MSFRIGQQTEFLYSDENDRPGPYDSPIIPLNLADGQ